MKTDTSNAVSTLNGLINLCRDGVEGFRLAAENAKSTELKSLFTRYSQQRAQFATELQAEVARYNHEPETAGSTLGAVHRGWMNMKTTFTGDVDAAIITECERGEDSIKQAYEDALQDSTLPLTAHQLIARQYDQVKLAHDRIRELELTRAS
jgi:uncharacterized protein (TIGR02284 family)